MIETFDCADNYSFILKADNNSVIELSGKKIGNSEVKSIINKLSQENCPVNLYINLSDNCIGPVEINYIAEFLSYEKGKRTVRGINLSFNEIDNQGALRLASMLMFNTRIQELIIFPQYGHYEHMYVIDFLELLIQRNILIKRYPQFVIEIERICIENGLYPLNKKHKNSIYSYLSKAISTEYILKNKDNYTFFKNSKTVVSKEFLSFASEISKFMGIINDDTASRAIDYTTKLMNPIHTCYSSIPPF